MPNIRHIMNLLDKNVEIRGGVWIGDYDKGVKEPLGQQGAAMGEPRL